MRRLKFGNGWLVWFVGLAVASAIGASSARAADAAGNGAEQAEPGLRFTPGMARAFAGVYAKQMLKQRYQLPDDKVADAEEKIARRLMQMAHKIDEPGRDLIERFVEEQLTYQSEGSGGGRFMPPGFGKEFADRVLPILPEVRELARGVSQDIRPMLGMKQQLKLAGDLMAFKTAVDGFESTLKKWSTGEVTDYRDPFRPQQEVKKDERGETERLKGARKSAEREADNGRAKAWERYFKRFKEFYGLDATQAATGESILREFTQREERLRADPGWRDEIYRAQLWSNLSWELEAAWAHPARALLEDQSVEVRASWNELEEGFKARLESIPTTAQRRAAEEKVAGLLREKKLQRPETEP